MQTLISDRNTGILYRKWIAEGSKACVILVHGLGSHSARWESLGDFLEWNGISSYAIELEGFGETKGPRGHVDSMKVYLDSVRALRGIIEKENPGNNVFLLGESMGGLIAWALSVGYPHLFRGLIAISPAFTSRLKFSLLDYLRIALLLIVNPKKKIDMPFNSRMCTRDGMIRRILDADDREYRVASAKLLYNLGVAQLKCALSLKKRLKIPALFLSAGKDFLVDPNATSRVYKQLTCPDKKLIKYPKMFHALSIDLGKEKVFSDILKWLEKRL